jgi:hypothetical protein
MTSGVFLFAAGRVIDGLNPAEAVGKTGSLLLRDVFLIIAATAFLTLVLLVWAVRRKRQRHRHRREHHTSTTPTTPVAETADDSSSPHHQHRHHRRRRQRDGHRGRNPTLAETGGLPPIRPGSTPRPPA